MFRCFGLIPLASEAVFEADLSASGGRQFRLSSRLESSWQQGTVLKLESELPPGFKGTEPRTLCYKHGMCVCGAASERSDDMDDCVLLHSKMVALLRPYIALKKKPKRKEGDSNEAAPDPRAAERSREARKPPTRKQLDKSFLVVCFHLPSEQQRRVRKAESDSAGVAGPFKSWWAVSVPEDEICEEHWYHISYCNLQTMMFSFLRLERVSSEPTLDVVGNTVIRLKVADELSVKTSVQAFSEFNLKLQWHVSWYAIDSTTKPIETTYVTPNTVDVQLLPESQIPTMFVWQGSADEKRLRKEKLRLGRKRKQTGEPGGRRSGRQGQVPLENDDAGTGSQDDGALGDELEGRADNFQEEGDRDESVDSDNGCGVGSLGGDVEDEGLDNVLRFASFFASCGPEGSSGNVPEAEQNSAEGATGSAEALPSAAASSSLPRPMASEPPSEPAAASTDTPSAKVKAKAKGKKKEVKEDSIVIEHNGVFYGTLRHNPKSKTITAFCATEGHGKHGSCRKERTADPTDRGRAQGKSGRPIGFLTYWLLNGHKHADAGSHVHALQSASLEERQRAREIFNSLQGARAFSKDAERKQDDGEPDEPVISC